MPKMSRAVWLLVVAGGLSVACSTSQGAKTGSEEESVGPIAEEPLAALGPGNVRAYASSLLQLLHYQGGYEMPIESYEEGEYTEWQGSGVSQGETFQRVLFSVREDGAEWWRYEARSRAMAGAEIVYTAEILLSAPERGDRRLLRMRVRYPGDETPSDVSVGDGTSGRWRVESRQQLDGKRLEESVVGEQTLQTPSGAIETRHLRVGRTGGEGAMNWWLSEEVPGGVVKFNETVPGEDGGARQRYEFELVDYGEGRTSSELGVLEEPGDGGESRGATGERFR